MSPAEILALASERGVSLKAGPGGRLKWSCQGSPPADLKDLLDLLAVHKQDVLAALLPAWDQAEADRLLAEVRGAVGHAEAEYRAGRMPEVGKNVVVLWQQVCEGLAAHHEMEAKRGWDAMSLLKAAAGRVLAAEGVKP